MSRQTIVLEKLRQSTPAIVTFFVVIILWEYLIGTLKIFPEYLVPTPTAIISAAMKYSVTYWLHHVQVTVTESLMGFALGSLVGLTSSIVITYSSLVRRILFPYLVVSQVVPKVAVAPLIVLWFGFGILPKIVISALMAFFPVVVATSTGLIDIETSLINLTRSFGATKWQTFVKIRFPNSLKYMMTGMKLAIMSSFIGAIVGEFVASSEGLGYVVLIAEISLNAPAMFISLGLMIVIGIVLYNVVEFSSKKLIPWGIAVELQVTE